MQKHRHRAISTKKGLKQAARRICCMMETVERRIMLSATDVSADGAATDDLLQWGPSQYVADAQMAPVTLAADSAPVVSESQTITFDPLTRTERVLPADSQAAA